MKQHLFKKHTRLSLSMALSLSFLSMTNGYAFDTDSSLSSDSYSGPSSPVLSTEEGELANLIGGGDLYAKSLSQFLQEHGEQENNILTSDFMSNARQLLQGLSPAYDLPAIKLALVKMLADVPERYLEDPRFIQEVLEFSKVIGRIDAVHLMSKKARQGESMGEIASFKPAVENLLQSMDRDGKVLERTQRSSIASSLASVPPQEHEDFIDIFLTLQDCVKSHQKYAIMRRLSALDPDRRRAPDFVKTLLQDTDARGPAQRAQKILRRLRDA